MRVIPVEDVLTKFEKGGDHKAVLSGLIGRTLGSISKEELLAARNAAADENDDQPVEADVPIREIAGEDEEE